MKKNHRSNFIKLLFPTLIIGSLIFLSACKEHNKFAQLKYTKAQVKHWLDSSNTENFVFQFYSPKIEDTQKPYQLVSYVADSSGVYPNGNNPDTLAIAKDSLVDLSGKAVLGNTYVTKQTIVTLITGAGGKPVDYDYLLFTPKIVASNQHVVYQITVIKGTSTVGSGASGGVDSNPSPPAMM